MNFSRVPNYSVTTNGDFSLCCLPSKSQIDRSMLLLGLLVVNWLQNRRSDYLDRSHLLARVKLVHEDAASDIALGCKSNDPAANIFVAKLESRCQNHIILELNRFVRTQSIVAVSCRNTLAAVRQGRRGLPVLAHW